MRAVRGRHKAALLFGCAILADVVVGWAACRTEPPRPEDVRELARRSLAVPLERPYAVDDYRFLDRAIGAASVVQLGESLHITDEFPRARLRLVRYLHEQLGFDVLALEGSLTQAWIAEEYLQTSADPRARKAARAQALAWLPLWNTPAMREVMVYIVDTQSTPRPLYLASFDIQPGTAPAFREGEDVLEALFASLRPYGPAPTAAVLDRVRRGLEPVIDCTTHGSDSASRVADADRAARDLATWIDAIMAAVAARRPAAHAAALRLVPDNFRQGAQLCRRSGGRVSHVYQSVRDELNAANALVLRDRVSAAHKIVLWAHHSHVAYDTTGKNIPSMGGRLRRMIGRQVYTVGLFAGHGRVIGGDLFGERDLPPVEKFGVERLLAAVDRPAYFVDLTALPRSDRRAGWLVEKTSRMETLTWRPTVLAGDFDGALYIDEVHPASLVESRIGRALLWIWGFVLEHAVGFAVLVVGGLGWALWSLGRFIWRCARRRLRSRGFSPPRSA